MNNNKAQLATQSNSGWKWYRICTWGAGLIIAYFLITEHRAHVITFLPYAFLLACPLMHLFMHRNHHGHSHHHKTIPAKEKT